MIYAGFWVRFWASVIDTITMLIFLILVALLVNDSSYMSSSMSSENMSSYSSYLHIDTNGGFLFNYLLPASLVMLFWFYKSATPGKLLLKLKIVDAKTGNKPTTVQFIVRYLGYFLSSIFLLGFIWAAFDKRKQGWHDKIAGTVVIKDASIEEVKFEE